MNKLPKSEKIVLTMYDKIEDGTIKYVITKSIYDEYIRYDFNGTDFVKIKKAKIPTDLE